MIIDLIALAVVVIGTLIGVHKGVGRMLMPLIALAAGAILACMAAQPLADIIYTRIVEPNVRSYIDNKIEECGATETVASVYKSVQGVVDKLDVEGTVTNSINLVKDSLDGIDIAGITGISLDALPSLEDSQMFNWIKGFLPDISLSGVDNMLSDFASKEIPETSQASAASDFLVGIFEKPMIMMMRNIIAVVVFLGASAILTMLMKIIFGVMDKVPVVGTTSKVLGGAVGLVIATLIALCFGFAVNSIVRADDIEWYAQREESKLCGTADTILEHVDFGSSTE